MSDSDSMRDKLEAARRGRLLHQKLSGKSLGEQLADSEMDSATAWVRKSRAQEVDRRERKKERILKNGNMLASQSERYDEEEQRAVTEQSQLACAVVGHAADDFKQGEDIILTMADQELVVSARDGSYELKVDGEILENVVMEEERRRKRIHA